MLGFTIMACSLLLLQSYKEYSKIVDTLIAILALTTAFITVFDFLRSR